MEKKICPVCNCELEEELEVCPKCGASLVEKGSEDAELNNQAAESEGLTDEHSFDAKTDGELENPVFEDTLEEIENHSHVRIDKLIKFIALLLSAVVLFFGGKFLWSNFGPGSVISVVLFDKEDVKGTYTDSVNGWYYTFKTGAKALEAKNANSASEEENVSFDGTFESGYSKDLIKRTVMGQYLYDNNLYEEYTSYIKENEFVTDDFAGFIDKKKISKAQLDAIDEKYQISETMKQDILKGKWKYDDMSKSILIYDEEGNLIDTLAVKRQGLVSEIGFMSGKTGFGKNFNSKYTGMNYEADTKSTIKTYNDGMFINTVEYLSDNESAHIAGTYLVKDGVVAFDYGEGIVRYRQVTGGLAKEVYVKK